MMRVLAWKEFREHRLVWLAMAGLSALLLIALLMLLEPAGTIPSLSEKGEIIPGIAVVMAFIYGLACGAMLFAGEREGGTQEFLDCLTGQRSRLWWRKLFMGLILSLAFGMFVGALLFGLELVAGVRTAGASWLSEAVWFAVIPGVALLTFAWGILGSALCRSVLAAAVSAMALYVVLGSIGFLLVFLAWDTARNWFKPKSPDLPDIVGGLTMAGMAILALTESGLVYCRTDLDRRRDPRRAPSRWESFLPLGSWRSLFWLTWRQGWKVALALLIVGLILGLAAPIGGVAASVWPVFTLIIGVMCGTCVFAWDQSGSAYRFFGNQRLPAGRTWLVKTSLWFSVALATAFIAFLAFLVHIGLAGEAERKSWSDWDQGAGPLWDLMGRVRFGCLWLITGFGVGQFLALLWRKSIVAIVVSIPVAAALAAVWIPSLVSGGLHAWQIFAVPIILLATTRISMWTWMADQLFSLRSATVLAGGGFLALACLTFGLNYRQSEIPNTGELFDVQAFVRNIPSPEENKARPAIKQALDELLEAEKQADVKLGPPKPPPKKPLPPPAQDAAVATSPSTEEQPEPPPTSYHELIQRVLDEGRPINDDPQLGKWLDEVFQGEWFQHLGEAVQLPLAVLIDPRTTTIGSDLQILHSCNGTGPILAARALQLQARKDNAAALDHILTALALSRHVRNKTLFYGYMSGIGIEKRAVDALQRWLQQLGPQAELLRRAVQELTRHEAAVPPYVESLKAGYLVTRNSLGDVSVRQAIFPISTKAHSLEKPFLSQVCATAWQAPWEKERLERLTNVVFAGWLRFAEADYPQLLQNDFDSKQRPESHAWLLKNWFPPPAGPAASLTREKLSDLLESSVLPQFLQRGSYPGPYFYYRQAELRGVRLQLALALYQLQEKKPAPNLQALVPRYLPELPLDPFSGKLFHYRVSAGETIFNNVGFPEEKIRVPAGQGIVWSVGPDGQDNGGKKQEARTPVLDPASSEQYGLDLIFLVPQWPKSENK